LIGCLNVKAKVIRAERYVCVWPIATDHVLMADGRYRSEADM
jgi:hypothetical protein